MPKRTVKIHSRPNKIKNLVEDRQPRLARQVVNEVIRRESTLKAKLKACQQRIKTSEVKKRLKNLLGNPSEVTDKLTEKIINSN